ncbi:MFS transporter [Angustibacter sp. McL0619]|uniref:MFS transporter n=1 Tax=Angustibacter sp. McL0619 TaxID=3415676 RepID=UPI003CE80FC3
MRRLHLDLTPARTSRDFRLLFAAGTVFYIGGMVSYVAVPFQLYHLTGSNFAVGAVGLVELVPLVVFGLYGGALADHVDRRTMLVATGVAQIVLTACLLANAASSDPQVWVIYVVAGLLAVAQSLQRPSREALLPRVVTHGQLPAAVALSSFGMQVGAFAGPMLGGVLLAGPGPAWAYGVDVAGLLVATGLFAALHRYPPSQESEPPSLAGILTGVRYAVGRRDLLGTYVVDMVAMFLALPVVLFPALASQVFDRPELLGVLYTAETVGGLAAGLTSGWVSHVNRHGKAIVVAAMCWGAAVALAGLAPNLWVAAGFLALGGAADSISGIFRGTVWHQTIPDSMRGRMAGIEMLSYSLGPLGGQVRSGFVADRTSVRAAIVSGGVLCVVGVGATAAWLRGFWTYDARTDEYARAERERRAQAGTD